MMKEVWEFDDNRQDHQANSDENKDATFVPPILRPANADALIDVINKLGRRSFSKLSKTCRYLNDFCWNEMGIKIPFNCAVDVTPAGFDIWTGDKDHLYVHRHRKDLSFAQFEKILRKKQFRINVNLIHITDLLDEAAVTRTNELLARIGCETVDRLWLRGVIHNTEPELLIQFVKEMRVKEFRCDMALPLGYTVNYFLENMTSFHYDDEVPADFYFGTKVPPHLHLMGVNSFPFDTFMGIIEGWGKFDFEIDEWNLGIQFFPTDLDFVDDFLQHFTSVHIGSIFERPLTSIRPLLLLEPEKFPRYLLRSDGQILRFFYSMADLFLRRMNFTQLRNKIPELFPSIEKEKKEEEEKNIANKKET